MSILFLLYNHPLIFSGKMIISSRLPDYKFCVQREDLKKKNRVNTWALSKWRLHLMRKEKHFDKNFIKSSVS